MGTLGMRVELDDLVAFQLQNFLELLTNSKEHISAFLRAATLSSCHIAVASTGNALTDGLGPDTNAVETLADVDDDSHDLAITLVL